MPAPRAPLTTTRPALLPGGDDARFRAMVHDALAFAARLSDIRARFGAAIGLTGPAYSTLITVAHLQAEEGVGVAAVAEHLHLSGAAITIEVGGLVRAGLVDKTVNPFDRRRVLLRVTPRARRLLDRLTALQAPANDALFAALDAPGFPRFAATLRALVAGADSALALLDATAQQAAS